MNLEQTLQHLIDSGCIHIELKTWTISPLGCEWTATIVDKRGYKGIGSSDNDLLGAIHNAVIDLKPATGADPKLPAKRV